MKKKQNNKKNVIYLAPHLYSFGEFAYHIFALKNIYYESIITVIAYPSQIKLITKVNKSLYNIATRDINLVLSTDNDLLWYTTRYSDKDKYSEIVVDNDYKFILYPYQRLYEQFYLLFQNQKPRYYLSLSDIELKAGEILKHKFKIPENAPIVTLHVRDSGFYGKNDRSKCRNATIDNYFPAIKYLIDNGYYVIRLGDKKMTPLKVSWPQFIDAPFHKDYIDMVDPYFIASSKFIISSNSGPYMIAAAFGIPRLATNFLINPINQCAWENDIFLFKKIYSHNLKRMLTFDEFYCSRLFANPEDHEQYDIDYIENTPEEILMATKEMIDRLKGSINIDVCKRVKNYFFEIQQENLINQHNNIHNMSFISALHFFSKKNCPISIEYLKLNPDLIEKKINSKYIINQNQINDAYETQMLAGNSYFEKANFEEAKMVYQYILSENNNNYEAYNNIGVIYFYTKEYEKCEEYLIQSLVIEPFYRLALINLYKLFFTKKEVKKIIPYIERYLLKNPEDKEIKKLYYDVALIHETNIKNAIIVDKKQIVKIKNIVSKPYLNNKYHKPQNNIIITSISKDDTLYLTNILKQTLDNIMFISNDNFDISVEQLPSIFTENRIAYIKNHDTLKFYEDLLVVLPFNITHLLFSEFGKMKIQSLINDYAYKIIAIIKSPFDIIMEWNNVEKKSEKNNIQKELSMWNKVLNNRTNSIEKLSQIWEFYASIFYGLQNYIEVITHEEINQAPNDALNKIYSYIGHYPNKVNNEIYKNNNQLEFEPLPEINHYIDKYCPSRLLYGYIYPQKNNKIPMIKKRRENYGVHAYNLLIK